MQQLNLSGKRTEFINRFPRSGFDYAGYEGYPCRGSMALTAQGQHALELLEIQGVEE